MSHIERTPSQRLGDELWKKAAKEIPRVFWQSPKFWTGSYLATIVGFTGLIGSSSQFFQVMPELMALSGVAGLVGRVLDKRSTIATIAKEEAVRRQGIDLGVGEQNDLLPKYPTKKDIWLGKKTFQVDLPHVIIGTLAPPLGFALGIVSLEAAFNNFRVGKQIDKAWEIHQKSEKNA